MPTATENGEAGIVDVVPSGGRVTKRSPYVDYQDVIGQECINHLGLQTPAGGPAVPLTNPGTK